MPSVWLVSDTHFGHEKTCTVFKRADGSPLRPFASAEEMDEVMVSRWNERVRPHDKVYHLGDVVINRKSLRILARLNGDKVLIKGNHDIFKMADYCQYFREIRAYHVMNGMILSHVPVHESSLARFGCNIHGHLHYQRVMQPRGIDSRTGITLYGHLIDPRYWCACVEHTDYAPILFEDAIKLIQAQGGVTNFRSHDQTTVD